MVGGFFQILLVKCAGQPKEEAGSAGEQFASNKVDAYTDVLPNFRPP